MGGAWVRGEKRGSCEGEGVQRRGVGYEGGDVKGKGDGGRRGEGREGLRVGFG